MPEQHWLASVTAFTGRQAFSLHMDGRKADVMGTAAPHGPELPVQAPSTGRSLLERTPAGDWSQGLLPSFSSAAVIARPKLLVQLQKRTD